MIKYLGMYIVWGVLGAFTRVNFWVFVYFLGVLLVVGGVMNPSVNADYFEGAEFGLDTLSFSLWVLRI
jgi:hypothetical protein